MLGSSMLDACRSNCHDGSTEEAFVAETAFYRDAWQEEAAEIHPAVRQPPATLGITLCICSNSVSVADEYGDGRAAMASPWGPEPGRSPWNDPVLNSLPVLPMIGGKAGKHGGAFPPGELPRAHSSGAAGSSGGAASSSMIPRAVSAGPLTASPLTAGILSEGFGSPDGRAATGPAPGWGAAGFFNKGETAFAKVVRSLSLDDTLTSTTRATEDAHDFGWDVHPAHWHGRCGCVHRLRPDAPPGPWLCHHFSVDGTHVAQSGLAAEHANRCAGALRAIDGEADSFDALVQPSEGCMGLRKPDRAGYPLLLRCSKPPPGPVCRRDSCPYLARNVICPYAARSAEHAPTSSGGASAASSSAAGGLRSREGSGGLPSTPGVSRLQGEDRIKESI